MLKVQIAKGEVLPFKFREDAEDFCGENFFDEGELVGKLEIVGAVEDVGKNFIVRGEIVCRKSFVCDRCLTQAAEVQTHKFEEEFDDAEVSDNLIDITELVRDTLIAGQPIKNLCKVDCKGLCPICGANLNEGECGCDREVIDPRLAALKDFRPIEEV